MKATVATRHDEPAIVAAAVEPDHTRSITMQVEGNTVTTTIERDTAGSLKATVDDVLVNLIVADSLETRQTIETMTSTEPTETNQ